MGRSKNDDRWTSRSNYEVLMISWVTKSTLSKGFIPLTRTLGTWQERGIGSIDVDVSYKVPKEEGRKSQLWYKAGNREERLIRINFCLSFGMNPRPLVQCTVEGRKQVLQCHAPGWLPLTTVRVGGRHSTEVAFALLTQQTRVRFSTFPRIFPNSWCCWD